ncbi:MAG TPA: hypothetical protein VGN26_23710 [Armatimonadota bacterium]|jgi:hypothetical protein
MTGTTVPQTALLQDACSLALQNVVARLDRERGYQPFFKVVLGPPARAVHDSWDYCDMAGRYVDALCLIRQVTGESAPEEEAGLRRFLLGNANPWDGLFYNQEGEGSQYAADMFCQSRVLIALCTWYQESGDPEVLSRLRGLVHGLSRIAERRDGYAFYPRNLYREGEWLEGGLFYQPKDLWSVKPGYGGTQLEGIARYAELTGDEVARGFIAEYLRYFLDVARVVDDEGAFTGHLHSQGIVPTMVGAAMHAEATGDRALLGRCERFLRFVLSHCGSFGWVPDGIGWPTCETCALGDVIHLAVRLSRLGEERPGDSDHRVPRARSTPASGSPELGASALPARRDFWYDVERFARNQLLENQFRDPGRVLEGRGPAPGTEVTVRGSFASWAHPNDLLGGPDIEGCCTGGAVRALFHVLNNCVGRSPDGALEVRMHFSVSTQNADVESHLPYEGRVVVRPKMAGTLRLRLPEGIPATDVTLEVNEALVPVRADGPYALVPDLVPGDQVVLRFPTPVMVRQEEVAGQVYTVTWKGNTVVRLEPEGPGYPTYRREEHLSPHAPQATWPYPVQGTAVRW